MGNCFHINEFHFSLRYQESAPDATDCRRLHLTHHRLTLQLMLKTITRTNLLSILIAGLLAAPITALTWHDHILSGGNGVHKIQSHPFDATESQRVVHAADSCLQCVRAGSFFASAIEELVVFIHDGEYRGDLPVSFEIIEYTNPSTPKRGPPNPLS